MGTTEDTQDRRAPESAAMPDAVDVAVEDLDSELETLLRAVAENAQELPRRAIPDGSDAAECITRSRRFNTTILDVSAGEIARRAVKNRIDRQTVIAVARRVASAQTKLMNDEQVLRFVAENHGFRKSLAGHMHEHLDAADLRRLHDIGARSTWLRLYPEHNRQGLDGFYSGNRKAGDAVFAQHKLSTSPQQLKKAAAKVGSTVRAKTELVVGRGTKVDARTADGLKGVRQAGRSVGEIRKMVEIAADPAKVTEAGAQAAQKVALKAGAGAAVIGAGISVATDIKSLRRGEIAAAELVENAAWAGGEAVVCTVGTAAATAVAAPTIAAGTAALAASSLAGSTAMAASLATLGPIGLGIGVGIGVGVGVKHVRKELRGRSR